MTPSTDRLDRIEAILETVSKDLGAISRNLGVVTDDVGGMSKGLEIVHRTLQETAFRQAEMAARQQYHDEAFERFDERMRVIQENTAENTANIGALTRIAEHHNRRFEDLEGGAPA